MLKVRFEKQLVPWWQNNFQQKNDNQLYGIFSNFDNEAENAFCSNLRGKKYFNIRFYKNFVLNFILCGADQTKKSSWLSFIKNSWFKH